MSAHSSSSNPQQKRNAPKFPQHKTSDLLLPPARRDQRRRPGGRRPGARIHSAAGGEPGLPAGTALARSPAGASTPRRQTPPGSRAEAAQPSLAPVKVRPAPARLDPDAEKRGFRPRTRAVRRVVHGCALRLGAATAKQTHGRRPFHLEDRRRGSALWCSASGVSHVTRR